MSATTAATPAGYILGNNPNHPGQAYSQDILRRCINARVANFVESRCSHTEPNQCRCLQPSRIVWRKYLFDALRTQDVNAANFHQLFNRAFQERPSNSGAARIVIETREQVPSSTGSFDCKKFVCGLVFVTIGASIISAIVVTSIYKGI